MIKAVIFDSDGTLIDSFELLMATFDHVAKEHGLRPPMAGDVKQLVARAVPAFEIWRTIFPDADTAKLLSTAGEFYGSNVSKAPTFAGLHDMLQCMEDIGLKLALVTGSTHKVHDVLQHHDIDKHFASVVHAERVTNGKPHPEGVELALSELETSPKETVMVGDSPNDILAGRNAGLAYCIGVSHGHGTPEELRVAGADYIVDSLPELLPLLQKLHAPTAAA